MTFVVCALGIYAQNTKVITGAVIDKNGNPLPNALVEATDGAESVTTDADGSFRIEVPIWLKSLTAKYAGLPDKEIKIKNKSQLVFEMKKTSFWFLDVAYSANFCEGNYFSRVGLMGGYLSNSNWGGYAKVLFPIGLGDFLPSVTLGVIRQVAQPVYMYLGAGYSPTYDYYWYSWNYRDGAMFDIGAIFKVKNFNIGIGYSISTDFYSSTNHSAQVSVGYCF